MLSNSNATQNDSWEWQTQQWCEMQLAVLQLHATFDMQDSATVPAVCEWLCEWLKFRFADCRSRLELPVMAFMAGSASGKYAQNAVNTVHTKHGEPWNGLTVFTDLQEWPKGMGGTK